MNDVSTVSASETGTLSQSMAGFVEGFDLDRGPAFALSSAVVVAL